MQELFADLDFKRQFGLGAVNSINWARIMFQITCATAKVALRLRIDTAVCF